MDQMGEEK